MSKRLKQRQIFFCVVKILLWSTPKTTGQSTKNQNKIKKPLSTLGIWA